MKTCNWIKGLALALCGVCAGGQAAADPVRVFAAASLQGPLDQIAQTHGAQARISYSGSGTIARQISLGAPADLVLLANTDWAAWLVDQGHVTGPAVSVLSNRLVVIAPAGAPPLAQADAQTLAARLGTGRLAMGQHMSVPAGQYAQAWLAHIGAWEALRPQLAETENVRAALALVARGEAPLGIVYASDAAASRAVDVVWSISPDSHPPILYQALALTPAGAELLAHVMTRLDVFVGAGFVAVR